MDAKRCRVVLRDCVDATLRRKLETSKSGQLSEVLKRHHETFLSRETFRMKADEAFLQHQKTKKVRFLCIM